MINNLKSTIGLSLFCIAFSFNAIAQTCATPPTCESLGYVFSAANCQDAFLLKCPFDTNKVYCTKPKCEVGYIAYSDGTCSPTSLDGKTMVGIVFDPINRVAWHPGSIFSGMSGGAYFTWYEANETCNGGSVLGISIKDSRLGTKAELEKWAAEFPKSILSSLPKVTQTVWTVSENDSSSAWAYKVAVKEKIIESQAMDKSTKNGVFCVKNF